MWRWVTHTASHTHARTLPWEFPNDCLCFSTWPWGLRRNKSSMLGWQTTQFLLFIHICCTHTCRHVCRHVHAYIYLLMIVTTNKFFFKQQKQWNLILRRLPPLDAISSFLPLEHNFCMLSGASHADLPSSTNMCRAGKSTGDLAPTANRL